MNHGLWSDITTELQKTDKEIYGNLRKPTDGSHFYLFIFTYSVSLYEGFSLKNRGLVSTIWSFLHIYITDIFIPGQASISCYLEKVLVSFSSNSPSENIHARNIIQTGQVILRNICVSIYKNSEKRGHKCEGEQKWDYEGVWEKRERKKCCIIIIIVRLNIIIPKIKSRANK